MLPEILILAPGGTAKWYVLPCKHKDKVEPNLGFPWRHLMGMGWPLRVSQPCTGKWQVRIEFMLLTSFKGQYPALMLLWSQDSQQGLLENTDALSSLPSTLTEW